MIPQSSLLLTLLLLTARISGAHPVALPPFRRDGRWDSALSARQTTDGETKPKPKPSKTQTTTTSTKPTNHKITVTKVNNSSTKVVHLSKAAKIGIGVAVAVVVLAIVFIVLVVPRIKRYRARRSGDQSEEDDEGQQEATKGGENMGQPWDQAEKPEMQRKQTFEPPPGPPPSPGPPPLGPPPSEAKV